MQQQETVEQYLKRGGTITTLPPSPNGIAAGAGLFEKESKSNNGTSTSDPQVGVRTVSWKELYEESDPEIDDPKYWKKLNERLDKALAKIEKNKIKQEKT